MQNDIAWDGYRDPIWQFSCNINNRFKNSVWRWNFVFCSIEVRWTWLICCIQLIKNTNWKNLKCMSDIRGSNTTTCRLKTFKPGPFTSRTDENVEKCIRLNTRIEGILLMIYLVVCEVFWGDRTRVFGWNGHICDELGTGYSTMIMLT